MILVIDNDDSVLNAIQLALKDYGVSSFHSFQEAKDALLNNETAIRLALVSNKEDIEIISNFIYRVNPTIPIFIMGIVDCSGPVKNVRGFLNKPFSLEALLGIVNSKHPNFDDVVFDPLGLLSKR